MIAGGLVSWAAAQHGDRPSLVFGDQVLSHADVERLSNRWAQALLALGLAPGERVAVLLDNSVHSVASVFGVEKAALTYVALNARHTLAEQLDWATALIEEDTRKAYGERRYFVLGFIGERLHAAVFTPRAGKVHVISLRKANTREVKRHEKTTQP